MNGVTAAEIAATSPLGKLCALELLNHWLGLAVCDGRSRRKVYFMPVAATPVITIESTERQNVSPSLLSSPSASAPTPTVRMLPYISAFWLFRFQMPLLS